MGRATFNCSGFYGANHYHMIVDYWTELVGDWPYIAMRWHYSMFISQDASWCSADYDNAVFTFHTNRHTFNIHIAGVAQTGVLASGTLDLPFGNGPSVTHTPGVNTSFYNFNAGGTISDKQTISGPSVYECSNPRDINAFGATVDYKLNNVRGYWRVYLWDVLHEIGWTVNPDNKSGSAVLTGLTPETHYKITTRVVNRNDGVAYTGGKFAEFITPADQLKLAYNLGDALKIAKVYYNDGQGIKKVKKVYVNDGEKIKKGINFN